ncbi:MAG: universal stress protein [Nitrososphaera sp.]|jgi:nucleotide-binding universal stress UspA family protein
MPNQGKIKRILVAIDNSGYKDRIIGLAFDLASSLNAELYAIHVIDRASMGAVGDLIGYYRGGKVEVYQEELKKQGEKLLDEVKAPAEHLGIKVTSEVVVASSVAGTLIDYARDHNIDLILIGTKGITGMQRFLMGSVANNVIANAHCPVLAVR